jgi:Tfp pilus assembly protein PilE
MGQQQLLLVILVTIIVGIATVVAINTFGSAADSANMDAVRQDVAQIAASAQGFYMKPEMLGGGGKDFTNITFANISFAADTVAGLVAANENGRYVISSPGATSFTVTAHPASDEDYEGGIPGTAATNTMEATVAEDGLTWVDSN